MFTSWHDNKYGIACSGHPISIFCLANALQHSFQNLEKLKTIKLKQNKRLNLLIGYHGCYSQML